MSTGAAESKKTDAHYRQLLAEAEQLQGVSLTEDAWRRLKKDPKAMVSLWFLIVLGLLAFFTPLLPLQPPLRTDLDRTFQPPSLESKPVDTDQLQAHFGDQFFLNWGMIHLRLNVLGTWSIPSIMGTDELGRDIFSRLFWGARVSLIVGVVATFVSLLIGVSYGAISGYFGGWIDDLMMRVVDVLYSVPFILVVIFLLTILSADAVKSWMNQYNIDRLAVFFLVVGAIYWLTMARVVRGQVISLKNEQFVDAARVVGAGWPRIVFLHLVPNLMSVVIVYLTLTIPRVMLFEAFLSYLGLGVEPPNVSWGLMANQGFVNITSVATYWWLILFPGIALGLTLFSLNFLGDGLRDALDPRLKNQ